MRDLKTNKIEYFVAKYKKREPVSRLTLLLLTLFFYSTREGIPGLRHYLYIKRLILRLGVLANSSLTNSTDLIWL